MLRAEMYLRIFPHRGMPARGSFPERILQEMLLREQRKQIAIETYHGHLLGAGLGVRHDLFALFTENLVDEITHNNYVPETIERKRRALRIFESRHAAPRLGLARSHGYTVKSALDMQPYTKEQIDELKAKRRSRLLDTKIRHGLERQSRATDANTPSRKK